MGICLVNGDADEKLAGLDGRIADWLTSTPNRVTIMEEIMAQLSPSEKKAIERAVVKYRAALERLYADKDVGSIVTDVGRDMIHVKTTPVRKEEPVLIE